MIVRVIRKMETDRAHGVLVLPYWKSAVYWPLICPSGQFSSNVIDWFDLPTSKMYNTFCKMFGNADLRFRMLALFIDFRGS